MLTFRRTFKMYSFMYVSRKSKSNTNEKQFLENKNFR